MKKTPSSNLTLAPLLVIFLAAAASGQGRTDGNNEAESRLTEPLTNAGIRIDESSLIEALKSKDVGIAGRAAMLLPRFSKNPQMVQALSVASTDERESVAVAAIRSLQTLEVTGWEPGAITRLPKMQERVSQLQLAGLLAKNGRHEGWSIVRTGLLDENMSMVAAENVEYFDGVTDQSGKRMNIIDELEAISRIAARTSREVVDRKVSELKERKNK